MYFLLFSAWRRALKKEKRLTLLECLIPNVMQQRILILFALMVLGHWSLLGQKEKNLVQSTKDNFNYSAFSPSSTRIMYGIAEEPGRLLGDIYLDSAFHKATVFFYPEVVKGYDPNASDSISGYDLRIDLREHVVEFVIGEFVKGVEPRAIRKITYQRRGAVHPTVLINTREFAGVPEKVFGFVEVLSSGEVEVMKFSELKLRKPTYSPALVSGDKNAYYYKQPLYLYADAQRTLIPFKARNKKELLELLRKRASAVEKFMDDNEISLKTDADLMRVLEFYNKKPM